MKCGWTLDRLEARMGYLPKFSTAPATQLMVGSLEPSLDAIELVCGKQLRNNFRNPLSTFNLILENHARGIHMQFWPQA